MFNDKQVLVGVCAMVAAFVFFTVLGQVKSHLSSADTVQVAVQASVQGAETQ